MSPALTMSCLLCESHDTTIVECIPVASLRSLYLHDFQIDVGYLFSGSTVEFRECSSCGLRFFAPPVTGDGKFYEALQLHPWYYLDSKAEYIHAARLIHPGNLVLDVGCGRGAFADAIPGTGYVGLDLNVNARQSAVSNRPKVLNETVETHAKNHRGAYDVVCGFQILEHVSNVRSFIAACVSCLKKNGLLVLSVPSDDSYIRAATNATTNLPPHHVSRWTDRALRSVGQLYELKTMAIEHEILEQVHIRDFNQIMLSSRLRRFAGLKASLVDTGWSGKILNRLSWHVSRLIKSPSNADAQSKGHTVTAVFQKP